MRKFIRNLLTEWRKLNLPFEDKTVVVAVSGGADSVSLLLALSELREAKKLRLNFVVAHFNHELRGAESEKDAEFVKDLAKYLNFEFVLGSIQYPISKIQNQKGNLEQAARRARYDFLRRTAEKHRACTLLTAHTVNDQAETFLLNLLRGSGLDGLGGMRAVRSLESPKSEIMLARPLLSWARREDTEKFVRERGIDFRSDQMNDDVKFTRVRVRKILLPLLAAEFNPKIVETLARTATLLQAEAERLADDYGGGRQATAAQNLLLKNLRTLSKSALYARLREWLRSARGDLRRVELKHLVAVENLIFSRKSGREVELPGGSSVVKKNGRLVFAETKVEKSPPAN